MGEPISVAYNMDCMEYMKTLPDNAFDLAVVDPPYGDGCSQTVHAGGGQYNRFGNPNSRFERYKMEPIRTMVRQVQEPNTGGHGKDKHHVGQVEHGQKSTAKKS